MPNADKFAIHIYAALAEQERQFISARRKAGLAAIPDGGGRAADAGSPRH
jgi:DNA invertase Pin-like site-specific DNA recombinase